MKKLLLCLLPLVLSAQVQNIPNTTFPAVRILLNSNFSWLNTNKQATITAGTQDQVLTGLFGLLSLVDCTSAGGVTQYSTTTHLMTCHTLTGADLPLPGASSLGGVKSLAAVSHRFLTSIGTDGLPVAARPVCADLSDAGAGCSSGVIGPITATFNTATSSCSTTGGGSCTASPTCGFGSGPCVVVTHSFNTSTPVPWGYDGSGNELGSAASSLAITSVTATSANVLTITLNVSSSGTILVGTGGRGIDGTNGTNGSGYTATSTTSLTPGAGSVSLTTQTGLAYSVGSCIQAVSAGTPSAYMIGLVTAYNSGTGALTFTAATLAAGACSGIGGSGAHTDWNLSISGIAGQQGTAGAAGNPGGTSGQIQWANGSVFAGFTASGAATINTSTGVVTLAAQYVIESKCFDLGSDNASADLVDADIGPQGRIFMVPKAATVTEITVAANAGTPNVIIQKNHAGSATDLVSGALATASAGAVACAATGAACLDGTAKSGSISIVTAASANVLAAGDWIQTKTGSSFASTGAKRLSVCVTYTF